MEVEIDPTRLLLSTEGGLEEEVGALYQQILGGICGDTEPSPLDILEARCKTADLWRYWRYTEDQTGLERLISASIGPNERRRQQCLHTDDMVALRTMHERAIRQTNRVFSGLRRDAAGYIEHSTSDDNVIRLKKVR